jgi:hypothetical protein
VVLNTPRPNSGFIWPTGCISLSLSSSSPTSSGPLETLYRGTGGLSNHWPTLVRQSPLLPYFPQTHTLASTRDSELSDLGYHIPMTYSFPSWTVLTWIVVIGSSVVMLLWIVIYSFFESSDFNDEVVILFGNVPFWACVVISVAIALGEFRPIGAPQPLLNCCQPHGS